MRDPTSGRVLRSLECGLDYVHGAGPFVFRQRHRFPSKEDAAIILERAHRGKQILPDKRHMNEGAQSVRSRVRRALNIRGAARLVWQSAPRWTLASLAFVFVQGLLPLLGLWLMKLVVDGVATTVTAPDKQTGFGHVAFLIALTGGVALVASLCRILAGLVSEIQAQAVTVGMSNCEKRLRMAERPWWARRSKTS
jgi:hypothetical protein